MRFIEIIPLDSYIAGSDNGQKALDRILEAGKGAEFEVLVGMLFPNGITYDEFDDLLENRQQEIFQELGIFGE